MTMGLFRRFGSRKQLRELRNTILIGCTPLTEAWLLSGLAKIGNLVFTTSADSFWADYADAAVPRPTRLRERAALPPRPRAEKALPAQRPMPNGLADFSQSI
jgi:hypothetical protein